MIIKKINTGSINFFACCEVDILQGLCTITLILIISRVSFTVIPFLKYYRFHKHLFSYLLHIYLDLKSPKFCCNSNKSLLHRHLNELELRT